jgi:8-oxo-dGTP pyrophosphatase MutT (NUDIX family)
VCEPVAVEAVVIDGRSYRVSWFDPPFVPPPQETTQALGICFTREGEIVLVTLDGNAWSLPGGTIEPGETLEQTLVREVREEACARVLQRRYIGCQHVEAGGRAHVGQPPRRPYRGHDGLGRVESFDGVGRELDADRLAGLRTGRFDDGRAAEDHGEHERVAGAPSEQGAPVDGEAVGGGPQREREPDQSCVVVALGAGLGAQRGVDVFDRPSGGCSEFLERDGLAAGQQPDRVRKELLPLDAPDQRGGLLDVVAAHDLSSVSGWAR